VTAKPAVNRLSRIEMICNAPDRLAEFYQSAFGFARTGQARIAEPAVTGVPGAAASTVRLRLGEQEIELTAIVPPGRPYPRGVSSRSPLFQHVAIVVTDMAAAYERLSANAGVTAISTAGPQLLPASSGSVTAYKFRDPDGHPLELLAFPRDSIPVQWRKPAVTACIGIDHSALSVADTERSVNFYERLGLRRVGGSLNRGPEQDKLDDVAGAVVEVTALAPPQISTPHLELLCYRDGADHPSPTLAKNDVAATRLFLEVRNGETLDALCAQNADAVLSRPVQVEAGVRRAMLRDPDGHLLYLETAR
jgi:catechol 2,3-dioxygenase-like lactoylglutathione lyase family enzyme